MPILEREDDIWPANLLEAAGECLQRSEWKWWCIYTISRHEKELMRKLRAMQIPHYGPVISKRYRSAAGRLRTSHVPLFPNYVFLLGDELMRYQAMTTNCVSRTSEVTARAALEEDLRRIQGVIASGIPLTPESRLQQGDPVRVRSGPFRGYEGVVLRREGKTRLLLAVRYLQQGVSMELDEAVLEPLHH